MSSAPKFKNVGLRPKQSPIELKEKMRKNYKNKVQNCRGMLMDKLRGPLAETDLHDTLTNIYRSMFNFSGETHNNEDFELMDILKKELVQEELEWWIKEYEKCHMLNADWASIEESNDVICPVCQKTNLHLINGNINCSFCNITIPTHKTLSEIKKHILNLVDNHNSMCNSDVQFVLVPDLNETAHVYIICENCMEMKMVI